MILFYLVLGSFVVGTIGTLVLAYIESKQKKK